MRKSVFYFAAVAAMAAGQAFATTLGSAPADINGNPYPRGPRPCGAYAK